MPTYTSSDFSTTNQYIKYRLVVTETGTNIQNNTSSVNIKLQAWRTNQGYTTDGHCYAIVYVDGEEYWDEWQYGDGHAISYDSYTVMLERNITITHNADGKKSINVSAYFDHARFTSNEQGFTVALTDIPRQANLTGAQDFNDTQNPVINYSNPAGNAVTSLQAGISFTGSTGSAPEISYRDVNKTGSSYTFNLTQAERTILYNNTRTANSWVIYFMLKTVVGGVTYYSKIQKRLTIVNANPTISALTYADTNSATVSITGNNQLIVQNNSTLRLTLGTLTALKGATLVKVKITYGSYSNETALSGSVASGLNYDLGALNYSNSISARAVLTDSRGNTATVTKTVTVLAWKLPTAIVKLSRKSNYYDESYLYVNADYSPLNNTNRLTSIQYRYKRDSETNYSAWATIQDESTTTLSLDNTSAFDFQVKVADRLGNTTYNAKLLRGLPILYIDKLHNSVGVNSLVGEDNMLAVKSKIYLMDNDAKPMFYIAPHSSTGNALAYWYNSSGKVVNQIYNGSFYAYDKDGNLGAQLKGDYYGLNNELSLYTKYDTSNDTVLLKAEGWTSSGTNKKAGSLYLRGDGQISMTASDGVIHCVRVDTSSSRKIKENIKPLTSEEAVKVLLLEAVTFDFKEKSLGTDKRGFIAEDVKEIIPQIVSDETEQKPASINYIELIPYLQAVIKEQAEIIKDLQERIEALESKLQN